MIKWLKPCRWTPFQRTNNVFLTSEHSIDVGTTFKRSYVYFYCGNISYYLGIIRQAAKVLFNLNVETTRELMPYKTILVYAKEGEDIRLMFPKKAQLPRTIIPAADEPKVSPFEFAKIFPFHMVSCCPVRTQRCFNIYTTSISFGRRRVNVKMTLCAIYLF